MQFNRAVTGKKVPFTKGGYDVRSEADLRRAIHERKLVGKVPISEYHPVQDPEGNLMPLLYPGEENVVNRCSPYCFRVTDEQREDMQKRV